MAHWNEERDRRWVHMMRADKLSREPEIKALIDRFEADGDIIYWRQYCHELWKRLKTERDEAPSSRRAQT